MPLYSIMFESKVTDENTAVDHNYIILLDLFIFFLFNLLQHNICH